MPALPVLARGPPAYLRPWDPLSPVRATVLPDPPRSRALRLGVRGPRVRGDAAAGNHTHRGPLPLRGARLDWELPEPRVSPVFRGVRARVRGAIPVRPFLHAGE